MCRSSVALILVVLFAGAACNDADMAGSSWRKTENAGPLKDSPEGDEPTLGTKANVDDANAVDPAEDGDLGDDGDTSGNVGSGSSTNKPKLPVSAGQIVSPGIKTLLDKLLGGDNNVTPNQPNENTIDFGTDKYFHIGDNRMEATSCKAELRLVAHEGIKFYFEFEVKKADTEVTLELAKVCGVDYDDSNTVKILNTNTGAEVASKTVPLGNAPIVISGSGLDVGSYTVLVESEPNAANAGDRDDFLIGNVKVTADKPIKAGKAGTRVR